MNETRKAIIELIEPYMNKTLSEGCLCLYMVQIGEGEYIPELEKYGKVDINSKYEKVIGHYDITAVLKYILNQKEIKIVAFNGKELELIDMPKGVF